MGMIVIVIVGVLSAVALPNFIGTKDKAEAGATVGSMIGLARECSLNAIQDSALAIPGVVLSTATLPGEGIKLTASTATKNCQGGASLENIKPFTAGSADGMKCGA